MYSIPKSLLHKIYEESNVSHLGNTACMYASIEWTIWVGNAEVVWEE